MPEAFILEIIVAALVFLFLNAGVTFLFIKFVGIKRGSEVENDDRPSMGWQNGRRYWSYEYDAEICDADFETQKDARTQAEVDFDDECRNGYEARINRTREIVLVMYVYNDQDERVILSRVPETITYEGRH